MIKNKQAKSFDYIIIGSGIAGLFTALFAREKGTVLILTKGSVSDCNTRYAQGGIAAPVGENDSVDLHVRDTIEAGAGLCDEEAVRILVEEAADRISDLVRYGVIFDTVNGQIALAREAAHTVPRILHVGGDSTGEYIELTLSRRVRETGIKVLEHCLVTGISVDDDAIKSISVLDTFTGSVTKFRCRHLILATGGGGRLFKFTTNPDIATGDGVALAYKAGVEIKDLEFFQFHPTALRLPGVQPFLISEAVRGEGGILRNIKKRPFMADYTSEKELAPRDIVARSIVYEMQKTRADHVFLDVTHLPASLVTTRFPQIYKFCLDVGLDITKELIPVAPAAHYQIGGIKVNTWGETNLRGIYAVGEVACTGVHGANRLASNSLLEAIVFSRRIIERSTHTLTKDVTSQQTTEQLYSLGGRKRLTKVPRRSLPNLQSLMWDKVGIIRTGKDLEYTADLLSIWEASSPEANDRTSYELSNMITTARLMTEAALLREESRGAHFRKDFPDTSPDWQKHIIFKNDDFLKL